MSAVEQSKDIPAPSNPSASDEQRLFMQEGADGFADMVETWRVERISESLGRLDASGAVEVLDRLPEATQIAVTEVMDARLLWRITNARLYPAGTVGRAMTSPRVAMRVDDTVDDAIRQIRSLESKSPIIGIWVASQGGVLVGSVAVSDLLVASGSSPLESIMDSDPPKLWATMPMADLQIAGIGVIEPVYAVVDHAGRLVGVVRAGALLRGLVDGLSAKAGEIMGVDSEERISTPARIGLRTRLPWLTVNLFTCFLPALVIAAFDEELIQHVLIVSFIPVLIGQSINAGGQSLAIMIRTLAIGDVETDRLLKSVGKEVRIGLATGAATGFLAAGGMLVAAKLSDNPSGVPLAWTVLLSMLGACVVGSAAGTVVPWAAKRIGFDPSMVSHLLLTTITDLVSVTLLLGIGSLLLSQGAIPVR